jgi:predicted transposase/invertase (TIGR01784 family)
VTRPQASRKSAPRKREGENSERDHGYKLLFSQKLLVEELLRGFLPRGWAERLDFSTLKKAGSSFVSDDLRERHDDVIWKVRWKGEEEHWFWVYLVLELQSKPERFMAVRVLTYVGLLLQELVRRGLLEPDQRLPAILPVVLYQGKQDWKAPQDLGSLFVEVPRELKGFLPKLKYLLLDESRLPLDRPELRDNLAAALFRLERAAPEEAVARVRDLNALTPSDESSLRRAFSIWLTRLFRKFPLEGTMPSEIDLENTPMLEQTLQEWAERLEQQGLQKGREEGRREAREEARREVLKEGELKGMRKMVLQMLRERFGSIPQPVRRRIEETSPSELRKVVRRIMTAKSLQETGLL